MPETAVDKNDLFAACKDEIGFSKYESAVQSVAVTQIMNQLPNRDLWPGIFRTDERHSLAALFPCKGVRHDAEMPLTEAD